MLSMPQFAFASSTVGQVLYVTMHSQLFLHQLITWHLLAAESLEWIRLINSTMCVSTHVVWDTPFLNLECTKVVTYLAVLL